ncbi:MULTISPECIES: carboxymuconolactone decarboxylase family protein [unclassified Streptomyces]|uniref:carboxymuconolactone decarboxylase family protein n=1 Tax=unclassified Streptomyces TaxID=2593676 RepID=UPI000DB97333|nr:MULTISPECIES: carboxymuconolactone decarboxylase family protein [unclassified Streptomyces]MYT68149.1 carboxymuconolactone decarboxylase family protein [Streptomyces sp. SID8367]RAJ72714.1 AhpD family alkylhydroperoxidase [Streptomyces sp. PsTaAH-137]
MTARLNLLGNPATTAARAARHFGAASQTILKESTLPAGTQRLVLLRVSQINADGYATDVWSKNAATAGEEATRIYLVAAWRESTVFNPAERAALELAEQGSRIADSSGGVTDEAWAEAAAHFDEDQLADLVMLISLMNATNRMAVLIGQRGGAYQPA